jgi:cytoskeletal protein RodZ
MENESENPSAVPTELNDLQAQCAWLRKQILTILVLVIIISGSFNIFLLRQWRYVSTDNKAAKEQIAQYQKVFEPQLNEFVRRIQEYGKTHPDFQPIMTKYGLYGTSAPPAAATPPKK